MRASKELEATYQLGRPAEITNNVVLAVFAVMGLQAIVAAPAGCLLGALHGVLMILTFGIYGLLLAIVWWLFFGGVLATSWLWAKAPALWPFWVILGTPFLLVASLLVLLAQPATSPEDRQARSIRTMLLMAWPYTYLVYRELGGHL